MFPSMVSSSSLANHSILKCEKQAVVQAQQRHESWADVGKRQAIRPWLVVTNNAAISHIGDKLKIANIFAWRVY